MLGALAEPSVWWCEVTLWTRSETAAQSPARVLSLRRVCAIPDHIWRWSATTALGQLPPILPTMLSHADSAAAAAAAAAAALNRAAAPSPCSRSRGGLQ